MKVSDRIWVLPDSLGSPPEIPAQLLLELAASIRQSGQVGLAARDDTEVARTRDMRREHMFPLGADIAKVAVFTGWPRR